MEEITAGHTHKFLEGGGEMSALILAMDWTANPIGSPGTWSQSLRTTLHTILDSKFPMFLFWGPELVCFYNDAYQSSLGQNGKHPSTLGRRGRECWAEVWHIIGPSISQVLSGGEAIWRENQLVPIYRNGHMEDVYWTYTYSPVTDDTGKIAGVLVICAETTEQVEVKKNKVENEWRLRGLISESMVATNVFIGPEMRIEMANETILKYWGKDASIIGKTLREAVPELDGQPFHQILDGVFATGIPYTGKEEYAELQVNGKLQGFYFDYRYKALRNADGEIYGVLNMVTDVTDQVLARKKLEESEQRLNMALSSARMGTWDFDPVTATTVYSERTYELFGFRVGDSITRESAMAAIAGEDRDRVLEALGKALQPGSDGIYDIEYSTINHHNGQRLTIRVQGKVFFDTNRQPVRFIGTTLDITDQKAQTDELEQRVAQRTQALEEANRSLQRSNSDLEQFAYVASHDLQEPLRKITAVGNRIEKKYAETLGDEGRMLLGIMTSAAGRMKLLIESLLAFSRMARKAETHEQVDLNRTVENIISDYGLKIGETDSRIDYDPLPVIEGVPQQLHQLFQNLLSNSLKFAKSDVPPLIRIRSAVIDAQEHQELKLDNSRTYHKITFEDNGIGFEEEYAEKIFTIFQRLHGVAQYQGAGIGLSICRQVVENHGGIIKAEGRLGAGAIFTIILPGQQQPATK